MWRATLFELLYALTVKVDSLTPGPRGMSDDDVDRLMDAFVLTGQAKRG